VTSYLHQIAVGLNTLKLQILEIDTKGLSLLLYEGNDPVKTLDIPVVELLRGSIALLLPLLDRGLTPIVGRGCELATSLDRLREVKASRSQLVFIAGDGGIGKSRLLLKFHRGLAAMLATFFA
jgi:hypothetical protein